MYVYETPDEKIRVVCMAARGAGREDKK